MEELVYVRLETSGSSLADLSTRAINERLLVGVFNELLSLDHHNNNNSSSSNSIRAQILPEGVNNTPGSGKCRSSVEKFVCRLVYPTCHFKRLDASALVRPPCREDCFLLRDLLCPNLSWSQFVDQLAQAFNSTLVASINWPLQLERQPEPPKSDGSTNDEIGGVRVPPIHFYWPHEHSIKNCEHLPPLRPILKQRAPIISSSPLPNWWPPLNPPSPPRELNTSEDQISSRQRRRRRASLARAWPVCSNAHLTKVAAVTTGPQEAAAVKNCLKSREGIDYRGQTNRTGGGLECQAWTSQSPHRHSSSELLFDNMSEAKNYCRNPGGMELKPWCYTMDPQLRWQYCDIPTCETG